MRLSWPFRRSQPSPGTGQGPSGDAGAPPEPRGAWRAMPPIAGAIGPTPLVAPGKPFADALAAADPPAPILAQLSHARSLDGPKGLVVGVARPKAASAPSLAMPVQRSPQGGGRGTAVTDGSPLASEPLPSGDAGHPATGHGPAAQVGVSQPARRLSVTSAEPIGHRRALTTAAGSAIPEPRAGLVGQPTAGPGRRQTAQERVPADVWVPPSPIQTPPAPAAAGATAIDAPRLTLGQARRLGLGAPIAGGPVKVPLRDDAAPPVSASAGPLPLHLSRGPSPSSVDPGTTTGQSARPDGPSAAIGTPGATPYGPPAPTPSPVGGAMGADAAATSFRSASPASGAGAGAARPQASRRQAALVSANPLRSSIQRSPAGAQRADQAPATSTGGHGLGATPGAPRADGAVRVHRGPDAARLATSLDARAFTHGSDVYLPASHGSLSSGTARSLLAHELTHVAQQRQLGSGLPAESTPHGRRLEAEAVAAERSGMLPLAVTRPASAGPVADPGRASTGPQRAPESPTHDGHGTTTIHVAAGTQRAPMNGSAPSKDSGRTSRTEQELEDLAHQLYARIGRRLRRELLVDRERAGLGIDLR